ncbi:hypothetical protein Syncc8109_1821 [Synechococcus sp. WH 8109]|nr:hypothetical protein Syncc8109_1821 [Synechococcus sp. WH 8109]
MKLPAITASKAAITSPRITEANSVNPPAQHFNEHQLRG